MSRLPRAFYERDTVQVARDLLGCMLISEADGVMTVGRIVEVEAYSGWEDEASHAYGRRTPRNEVMFGAAGVSYVFLIYGMHWLFNIVARPSAADYGAAVLIRAIEPVAGLQHMSKRRAGRRRTEWTSGPGRLTAALGIDGGHNSIDLTAPYAPLWVEYGAAIPDHQVMCGPRIGIRASEPWLSNPLRFWVKGSPYISR